MNSTQGIICEFVKNHWPISANGTDQFTGSRTPNQMLTCGFSYFHTIDVPEPFWAVYFSKPVIAYSYFISSGNDLNTLYNWDLYQINSNNKWIHIDKQTHFDTRENTKKIILQNATKTYGFKLVSGLDYEGDNNYLKIRKIEFFGKVFYSNTCTQTIRPFISVLLYIFFFF